MYISLTGSLLKVKTSLDRVLTERRLPFPMEILQRQKLSAWFLNI